MRAARVDGVDWRQRQTPAATLGLAKMPADRDGNCSLKTRCCNQLIIFASQASATELTRGYRLRLLRFQNPVGRQLSQKS